MSGILAIQTTLGNFSKLEFDNVSAFNLQRSGVLSMNQLTLLLNTDGTFSQSGTDSYTYAGPTKYLNPTGPGAGALFEVSVTLTAINQDTPSYYFTILGTTVNENTPVPFTTGFVSLNTQKTIDGFGSGSLSDAGRIDGSITIRRKGTSETITRALTLRI